MTPISLSSRKLQRTPVLAPRFDKVQYCDPSDFLLYGFCPDCDPNSDPDCIVGTAPPIGGGGGGGGGGGTPPVPTISSVTFSSSTVVNGTTTVAAGSTQTVTITGSNFSTSGFVQVCPNDGSGGPCIQPTSPPTWGAITLSVVFTIPLSAGGHGFCMQVKAAQFAPATASTCNAPALFFVRAAQPTIKIASRPILITPRSTAGQCAATLTSSAMCGDATCPPGGSYTWASSNSAVGFTTPSSGPSATQVTLGILGTGGTTTITLSYAGPFGGNATDSFTFVLSDDTVAIAWVNGQAITPVFSPGGLGDPIVQALGYGGVTALSCGVTLLSWENQGYLGEGSANDGLTAAEQLYANGFLLSGTGNNPPPRVSPGDQRNPADASYIGGGDYRLYQRLQVSYEISGDARGIDRNSVRYLQEVVQTGTTPEPCSGMQLFSKPVEAHPDNGQAGTSLDGTLVYQLNSARIGPDGQAVNQFLNGPAGGTLSQSTPWIWTAIQYDGNGRIQPWVQGGPTGNLQIFPQYDVYTNTSNLQNFTQGLLMTFIALNSSSQFGGPL